MGVVYRAHDRQTGEAVALKLLTRTGAELLERFRREARVLAALRHPAIVRHVDDGLTRARRALHRDGVARGRAALGASRRAGRSVFATRVALVRRVAEALASRARERHRPSRHQAREPVSARQQARRGRRARLRARAARGRDAGGGEAKLTRTEAVLGTPGYMSPEQASGQRDVDARADVFALGCLLYELLTRIAPFRAETFVAALARVLLEDPPPVRRSRAARAARARSAGGAPCSRKDPEREAARRGERGRRCCARSSCPRRTSRPASEPSSVALGEAERRVVSVVLARGLGEAGADAADVTRELSTRHGIPLRPTRGRLAARDLRRAERRGSGRARGAGGHGHRVGDARTLASRSRPA